MIHMPRSQSRRGKLCSIKEIICLSIVVASQSVQVPCSSSLHSQICGTSKHAAPTRTRGQRLVTSTTLLFYFLSALLHQQFVLSVCPVPLPSSRSVATCVESSGARARVPTSTVYIQPVCLLSPPFCSSSCRLFSISHIYMYVPTTVPTPPPPPHQLLLHRQSRDRVI
ncbi:hypothetical protein BKA80DRAFT_51656 [Phyllosticta citrichinensis]